MKFSFELLKDAKSYFDQRLSRSLKDKEVEMFLEELAQLGGLLAKNIDVLLGEKQN